MVVLLKILILVAKIEFFYISFILYYFFLFFKTFLLNNLLFSDYKKNYFNTFY